MTNEITHKTEGDPGQPGQEGQEGHPPGGTGGRGGRGGMGRRGRRGVPGRTSIFPIIGYLILVIGVIAGFYGQYGISQRNAKAIAVQCAQEKSLEARIKNNEDFLRMNPNGIPGISAAVIKRSTRVLQDEKDIFERELRGECGEERP